MPKESIPNKLDPFRFADNAVSIDGVLPVNQMERLRTSLFKDDGEVEVSLRFGIDEEGLRFLRGHYETSLILQCQRCMESLVYGIAGDFALGIVSTEKAGEQLPNRYDPVMAKDGMLKVSDIVEDELIISLPIVPMHNPSECQVKLPLAADSGELFESEKENPFKVIELLRSKRDPK